MEQEAINTIIEVVEESVTLTPEEVEESTIQ
jgi:hypothetical protein